MALMVLIVLALAASVSCQAQCPDQMDADVLILGAGMAGLGAAETLSEGGIDNFLIIEMRDKIGGRVQSASFGGGIVELGPQWIFSLDFSAPEEIQHPLIPLIRRCNITLRDVPHFLLGRVSYNSNGEDITALVDEAMARYSAALSPDVIQSILSSLPDGADIPFTQGLRVGGWNPRTQLEEHAEFVIYDTDFAVPTDLGGYRDFFDLPAERFFQFGLNPLSYVVTNPEGYIAIPQCLAEEFLSENDPRLVLGTTIVEIITGDECVCAIASDERRFCAPYAISTFSVGELQNGFIKFTPELPFIKRLTLNQFELGNFLKVFIAFNETFWDTDLDFITYLDERRSREYYPFFIPWGSYFPERPHILEVILTGNEAKRVAYQDIEITRQDIAEIMRNIYGERASDPVDIIMHDFIVNPYFFGDFTAVSAGIGRRQFDEINTPIGNLYFAGEAFSFNQRGTVHGALLHGRETAARIVELLQGPIQVFFVNDTPRVEGNTVSAEFRTSKSATALECVISYRLPRQNCSSGRVTFSGLANGTYQLRVIARVEGEDVETERGIADSIVTVTSGGVCAAHFINRGVSVTGRRAAVEFSSSGEPVSEFQCTLDDASLETCTSPLVLRDLSPGLHRLRIWPVCAGESTRTVALIDIA